MATNGPLTVHPENGRYLRDASGAPVFLVGPNTYRVNMDGELADPPEPFDWPGWLAGMVAEGHNFQKFWLVEQTKDGAGSTTGVFWLPPIWSRPGPGVAADGKPKFDVTIPNPEYLTRLRDRALACQAAGIYVSVMFFQGWSVETKDASGNSGWLTHPFNAANNINGVDGDPGGDGHGLEIFEGSVPAVVAAHDTYIQAVVAAVGDLDNVMWELINEVRGTNGAWAYMARMVTVIRAAEVANSVAAKPILVSHTHPEPTGSNARLFSFSGAQIFAPGRYDPNELYAPPRQASGPINPPTADGTRVISFDSDHNHNDPALPDPQSIWADGVFAREMFWKNALRGAGILSMLLLTSGNVFTRPMTNTRVVLKAIRETMESLGSLAAMTPQNALASSGYCLAHPAPGGEYLVYLPTGGEVTLDLALTKGAIRVDWINPATGAVTPASDIEGGGSTVLSSPLGAGDAVVRLTSREAGMPGTWNIVIRAPRVANADAYRFYLGGIALPGDVPQTQVGVDPEKMHALPGVEPEIHNVIVGAASILNGVLSRLTTENVRLSVEEETAPAPPASVRIVSKIFVPDE